MTSLHVTTVLNCHWLLALSGSFQHLYVHCMPVNGRCHVSLYDCLAHWYTQLKRLPAFQLWHREELRAGSLFLPSHTMTPSYASVQEESYKYYINWHLLEILHSVDFTTQIFLHFWTNMIAEICAVLRCYAACSFHFSPTFRDNLWVPSWLLKMEPIGCP